MKLTPQGRRDILREMIIADLLNEKSWSRRYGISVRQVQRLRAEAREQLARLRMAGKPPSHHEVLCLTTLAQTGPAKVTAA